MYPTHPYAPWCIPESWHVRACVCDLGGRGSDGSCMAGTVSKGMDSVRRRQVAAPSGPAAGTPMVPRLHPAPQPAQATACGSAFQSSAHEAGRRPLLSVTAACSAVTVLQLYPTLNLPHHSAAGWHACNQEKRGRCCMRHTRPTSDAQQTSCRRRAGWHRGVLKGTEGYSRVLGSWIECMRAHRTGTMLSAACGTHVQPAMRSKHRGRRHAGWH
jgi:hypothetical protein